MISAPLSVSCNWATAMSFGPRPALSKAARAASIVGVSPLSTEREGENTSKLFSGLVFTAADLNLTRSEEHTSELQSLMRISYAVFCLKKKNTTTLLHNIHSQHNKTDIIGSPDLNCINI